MEEVNLVLFTVDIGCYDQFLYEDETMNRMQENLTLWDSIVNGRWFTETDFILCFTKQAKLAAKIKDSPLATYFTDFVPSDPPDLKSATKYFIDRFVSLSQNDNKTIYTIVLPDLPTKEDWEAIKNIFWKVHERELEKHSSSPRY